MLTVHHLNDSRSQRILWLLEELAVPYEMKRYQRNAQTRLAPPELDAVHPLGKSPVITDGDVTIAESGAIVDYIIRHHGKGALMPAAGSADYEAYNEWLHYSEGSAMLPLMLNLYVSRLKEAGAPLHPRIDSEMANHLGYVDRALKGKQFLPPLRGRVGEGGGHRRRYRVPGAAQHERSEWCAAEPGSTLYEAQMGPGSAKQRCAPHRARDMRAGNHPIPTISCINNRPAPQALGHWGPIWYPPSAASDRHP